MSATDLTGTAPEPARFEIRSIEEAVEALDYFNGFHDGFIKELHVRSHDVFEARGVQFCAGQLDLEIIFAHYNYQADRKPHTQLVQARFLHVGDLQAAFSGQSHEWTVYELGIQAAEPADEDPPDGRPLAAVLKQSRWDGSTEWVRSEDLTFRFQQAEFSEL